MKKIILLILTIVVITSLFSCGKEELVERSIDGVAAYLGYHDGEDIDIYSEEEQMYGALAGKYFKDGQVSIYEFSPDSPSYEFCPAKRTHVWMDLYCFMRKKWPITKWS